MIVEVLLETKCNFNSMNLRLQIINDTPELSYLETVAKKRKQVISMCALTIVSYYVGELFFHGAWDIYLMGTGFNQVSIEIDVWIIHEFLDLTTLFILALIINSLKRNASEGEGVLDINHLDPRDHM